MLVGWAVAAKSGDLQNVPRGQSRMRTRSPILLNRQNCLLRRIKTLKHRQTLCAGRASFVVRRRSERPPNQKRPVHHDPQVSIPPLGDPEAERVSGGFGREDGVVLGDLGKPGANVLVVEGD